MSAFRHPAILPEPPNELKLHSERLRQCIIERIQESGPLSFMQYMEMALYEPGLGYYSAGLHKFGEQGDFVTAPELGNIFARCMAEQVTELAGLLGSYHLLEVGAGSGRLAADLLSSLEEGSAPSRYLILERSADLRRIQRETIAASIPQWLDRVEWLDAPPADPWQGVIIANELLDALPVERFRLSSGRIEQAMVQAAKTGFYWDWREADGTLKTAVDHALDGRQASLAEGYESELCTLLSPWLQGLVAGLKRGCLLLVDYGYPREEYNAPQRGMGTLVCHYRHHAHDDPFRYPGLQDLTAFVDFTAVAEAAGSSALDCLGYCSQAMFLFGCGLEAAMQDLETDDERARIELASEIRRLTLPGEMGEKFQVMALGRGLDTALRGFSMQDLRHRL